MSNETKLVRTPAILPKVEDAPKTLPDALESTSEGSEGTSLDPIPRVTKSDLEDRRLAVYKLRLRGLSFEKIATNLGISSSTAKRDYEEAKQLGKASLEEFDTKSFATDLLASIDNLIAEAWQDYTLSAIGSTMRAKFLDLIRVLEKDKLYVLQEIGNIQRQAEKVENTVSIELIQGWAAGAKEAAIQAFIQGSLTTKLLPPALDPNILEIEEKKE